MYTFLLGEVSWQKDLLSLSMSHNHYHPPHHHVALSLILSFFYLQHIKSHVSPPCLRGSRPQHRLCIIYNSNVNHHLSHLLPKTILYHTIVANVMNVLFWYSRIPLKMECSLLALKRVIFWKTTPLEWHLKLCLNMIGIGIKCCD